MIEIRNISGELLMSVPILAEAVSHEELMTSDYVQLSWRASSGDLLPVGSYIEHDGEKYSLLDNYSPRMVNEVEFQYTPQFQSRIMRWQKTIVPVYEYDADGITVKSRELDWEFTGTPSDAMFMVKQAILNELGEEWNVELGENLPETISFTSQSSSIWSILSEIAELCETEWWADKAANYLYLDKCIRGLVVRLCVGENIKTPSITNSSDGYYTRFYAFGSTRNVTQDFGAVKGSIVNKRLTLNPIKYPGGYKDIKGHFENDVFVSDLLPDEVFAMPLYFDDVFPSSNLTVSGVRRRMRYHMDSDGNKIKIGGTDDNPEYSQYAIWYFQIEGFDFSEELIIENLELSVNFKSGQLRGREFKLVYHPEAKMVADNADVDTEFSVREGDYEIIFDEQTEGFIIPGVDYIIPEDGDEVVLFNIEMPEEYTSAAMVDLESELDKEILRRSLDNKSYEFSSNPVAFYEDGLDVILGQRTQFIYNGVGFTTRVIMVEKHLDYVFEQKIRIGNEIIKGSRQQIRDEVRNVGKEVHRLSEQSDISASIQREHSRDLMLTMSRYLSMRDTIDMLQGAISGFTEGISPITVQTMAMLVGDESLQFKLTVSRNDLTPVNKPIIYDPTAKQLNAGACALIHLTLGINTITVATSRKISDFKSWDIEEWHSEIFDDATKKYYVYAKVEASGTSGVFMVSETVIEMESQISDDNGVLTGYYHFLVGILNAEYNGSRDFVTLYGFTEVLPGQITTDVIRSADGNTYFDLANSKIGGNITFIASDGSTKEMADFATEVQDQIDGVVENWSEEGQPYIDNYPVSEWATDADKIAHINDTYINIEEYVDDETTPTAGHAWRWCRCAEGITSYFDIEKEVTTTDWEKIGKIDPNAPYTVVQTRRNGIVISTKSVTLDTDLLVNTGPPVYIKVESTTGDVYVKDASSYFKGYYPISLRFIYTGYVSVNDKDGNTINLHWHPIADSDAVRALKKVNDIEYLADTFVKGSTTINGGLVMTDMVAVRNSEEEEVEAFLNGSEFAADTEHGKLLIAAGIEQGEATLEERAKEANTRIYEDGCVYTKNMHLEEGCTVGASIRITEDGLEVDSPNAGSIKINEASGFVSENEQMKMLVGGDGCSNHAMEIFSKEAQFYMSCPSMPTLIGLASLNDVIQCYFGTIAGLRTRTRVLTSNGGSATGSRNVLDNLDFSVLINTASGTCYMQLPSEPCDGQEYIIESKGAGLNIISADRTVYSMSSGATAAVGGATTKDAGRYVLRFKYYEAIQQWTCSTLQ